MISWRSSFCQTHVLEMESVEAGLACCLNQNQAASDQSLLAGVKIIEGKIHVTQKRGIT